MPLGATEGKSLRRIVCSLRGERSCESGQVLAQLRRRERPAGAMRDSQPACVNHTSRIGQDSGKISDKRKKIARRSANSVGLRLSRKGCQSEGLAKPPGERESRKPVAVAEEVQAQ